MHNFRNFCTVFQKTMPKLCQKLCQNIHFQKTKFAFIKPLYHKPHKKQKIFKIKTMPKSNSYINNTQPIASYIEVLTLIFLLNF